MDQAQLARNIARAKASRLRLFALEPAPCLPRSHQRPGSFHLAAASSEQSVEPAATAARDRWQTACERQHPDLTNPPLYPMLLALVLRLSPFELPDVDPGIDRLGPERFLDHPLQPGSLLVGCRPRVRSCEKDFRPARSLALRHCRGCSEPLWRLTTTGQGVSLQMVIFLLLAGALVRIESSGRPRRANSGNALDPAFGLGRRPSGIGRTDSLCFGRSDRALGGHAGFRAHSQTPAWWPVACWLSFSYSHRGWGATII